jgi:hypothetical protein
MKKKIIYGASLFFMLALAGCSEKQNSEKSNSSPESVAEEKETKKELTWNEYSNEQKEKKVNETLSEKNLGHYPVSPIIEELDYLYQNTGYTMGEFNAALDESIKKLEQLKLVEVIDRYGDDYFTEEDNLLSHDIHHVYEKDNKVFVLHGTSSSEDNLFLSVAEDGVWVKKDIPIRSNDVKIPNTIYDTDQRVSRLNSSTKHSPSGSRFYGNHKYTFFRSNVIGSPIIMADLEFDETGLVSEKIILEADGDNIYLAKTDTDSPAFLFEKKNGNEKSLKVYVNYDFSKPKYEVQVQSRYYGSIIHGNTNDLYINLTRGLLTYGDEDTGQLDLNSGEPIWDGDGQEKFWDLEFDTNTFESYAEDLMTITDAESNSIAKYNGDLELVGEELPIPIELDVDPGASFRGYKQTVTEDEIHIWQPVTYKNKIHLQLVRIAKGIDSGSSGSEETQGNVSNETSTNKNESLPSDLDPTLKKLVGEWETSAQDHYSMEFKADGTLNFHFNERNEVMKGSFKLDGQTLTIITPDKTSEHEIVLVGKDELQLSSKETGKLIHYTKVK